MDAVRDSAVQLSRVGSSVVVAYASGDGGERHVDSAHIWVRHESQGKRIDVWRTARNRRVHNEESVLEKDSSVGGIGGPEREVAHSASEIGCGRRGELAVCVDERGGVDIEELVTSDNANRTSLDHDRLAHLG